MLPILDSLREALKPLQELREQITRSMAVALEPLNAIKKSLDMSGLAKGLSAWGNMLDNNDLDESNSDIEK